MTSAVWEIVLAVAVLVAGAAAAYYHFTATGKRRKRHPSSPTEEFPDMSGVVVAVDFDGTIATNAYPDVGQVVPGAVDCLQDMTSKGAKLILLTMRDGDDLAAAQKACSDAGCPDFWAVNSNPSQSSWTSSAKVFANYYVDDSNVGVPLVMPSDAGSIDPDGKPYVDWDGARSVLVERLSA